MIPRKTRKGAKTLSGASDSIKNWPVRERRRERLIAEGPEKLTDAELLAIALRVGRGTFKSGVSGQSALALARSLLADFRGLHGLERADIRDLLAVSGLSVAKVAQIKSAFELGKRLRSGAARPRTFESASAVAAYLHPRLSRAKDEIVVALLLDGQNRLIEEKIVSEGTPTQATVYVRRVMEAALRASAAAIVLAHNHPSGELSPSSEDDVTTRELDVGIPFILTFHRRTQADSAPWDRTGTDGNRVHFDLAAFRYVAYDNPLNLRDQLKAKLDNLYKGYASA